MTQEPPQEPPRNVPPPPPQSQVPNRMPPPTRPQPIQTEQTHTESGSGRYDRTSQTWVDSQGRVVTQEQASFVDPRFRRRQTLNRIAAVISFLVGLLGVLLLSRFFLLLFAANPTNDIVDFVYDVTKPFVEPFEGIFDNHVFDVDNVIEWSSLIAFFVWSLIGGAIVSLMYFLFDKPASGEEVTTTTRRDMP
jgi:uncharacterized protein YggT (Ycf19 family)